MWKGRRQDTCSGGEGTAVVLGGASPHPTSRGNSRAVNLHSHQDYSRELKPKGGMRRGGAALPSALS
jgi:hypothetical protein